MTSEESNRLLSASLERIAPISLDEMDAVKLMNRIDTKYLTDLGTLTRLLEDAADAGYRALCVDGVKRIPYRSVYFDTPGLKMYFDHRDQKLMRQKVRTRCYATSGLTFLEIKRKNNKGRTKKKRLRIPENELEDFRTDPEAVEFLASHSAFTAEALSPELLTLFSRITLVNPERSERLTIDTDLRFKNIRSGKDAFLGPAVIIELKQDSRAPSRMKSILLHHRILPFRLSKYCVAVTLTDPAARPGRFKLKVRRIEKVIHQSLFQ